MKTSEQINELTNALAKAQGNFSPAKLNAVNPFLKNKYADLGSVIAAVRPALSDNGLSFVQMVGGKQSLRLKTRIMHTSGQWIEESFPLVVPESERGKSAMQVMGSVITYARRYTLSAMLGIYAGDDVDGTDRAPQKNGTSPKVQSKPDPDDRADESPAAQEDREELRDITLGNDPKLSRHFHATGRDAYGDGWEKKRAELYTHFGVKSSKDLTFEQAHKLIDGMKMNGDG